MFPLARMLRRLFQKLFQPLRTFWKPLLGNQKDRFRESFSPHQLQRQHYHNQGWKGLLSLKVSIQFAGLGCHSHIFLYNYHRPLYYCKLCVNSVTIQTRGIQRRWMLLLTQTPQQMPSRSWFTLRLRRRVNERRGSGLKVTSRLSYLTRSCPITLWVNECDGVKVIVQLPRAY
jgi:hypothetical protein